MRAALRLLLASSWPEVAIEIATHLPTHQAELAGPERHGHALSGARVLTCKTNAQTYNTMSSA